jgi:hypothetical protein
MEERVEAVLAYLRRRETANKTSQKCQVET